jgi:hypothetical protein
MTALWPTPTQRLPFWVSTGVPPTLLSRIETPSRSTMNVPSYLLSIATCPIEASYRSAQRTSGRGGDVTVAEAAPRCTSL